MSILILAIDFGTTTTVVCGDLQGTGNPMFIKDENSSLIPSLIYVKDDGTRYYPEDMTNRHGHVYSHGYWKVPQNNHHPHIIFDKKQYEKFADKETSIYPQALDMVIEANTLEELAKKIGAVPEKLQEQVAEFNFFAT